MPNNREEKFLNIISKTLSDSTFLGNDCAYLPGYNLAISTDTLVEDVHFRLKTISPFALGKKALLVNISDILSSGAKPEYLTVSLSGNLTGGFVEEFYKGLNTTAEEFHLKVIGGDLTGGDKITISITISGNTKGRNLSSRSAAKPGYIVLLAGEHGSSAAGLSILENKPLKNPDIERFKAHLVKAHLEPALYPQISEAVAKNCTNYAMMDTSDGLFDALKKVSDASGAGFSIEFDKIPKKIQDFNTVMFGGEDYGLLICIKEEDYKKIKGLNIPKIGTVTKDKRILVDNKEVSEDFRFEHF